LESGSRSGQNIANLCGHNSAKLQYYYYAPFGQLTMQGGGSPQPYQFTGREADETGLMYYRARYYNPNWGRFVSEDPMGFAGGINPFVYAGNNPVSLTDPSGKSTHDYANGNFQWLPPYPGSWLYDYCYGRNDFCWHNFLVNTRNDMRGVVRFFKGASDDLMATVAAIVESLTPGVKLSKETQQALVDSKQYIDSGTKPTWAGQNWGTPFQNREGLLPNTPGVTYTEYGVEPTAGMNAPGKFRIVTGSDGTYWYSPDHYTTFIQIIFR
jgi:RHS repeat-associated protein